MFASKSTTPLVTLVIVCFVYSNSAKHALRAVENTTQSKTSKTPGKHRNEHMDVQTTRAPPIDSDEDESTRLSMQFETFSGTYILQTTQDKVLINRPTTKVGPLRPSKRILSDEERLIQSLFSTYNPVARPVLKSSNTVNVQIMFSLMQVKDLNVRSQILTTTGLLILDWTDERLRWDPAEYNGMHDINIEANVLWRPEFAVINGAEKIHEEYDQFRAVISSNGGIHWEPGGVFETLCEIDITYYPFDEQTCVLTLGAWSYPTTKMNLTNPLNMVNLDSYTKNGEWEIPGTEVERSEFAYKNNPKERFGFISFKIHMRRRHTFYVLNVILPSIMTSILLLSVFFCPPGQKVQIGVVVLLSFRIFLLNVSGDIPRTSDHIPILGIYLTCINAITTLSMVLTVFVLNLHHISDRPVPACVKTCVFVYLARVLGMHKVRPSNIRDAGMDERATIVEPRSRRVRKSPDHRYVHLAPLRETGKPPNYSEDWKRLAEIFDRLFFWLFLLAVLGSTVVLFHPLIGLPRRSKWHT